jgi:hypothetical protein
MSMSIAAAAPSHAFAAMMMPMARPNLPVGAAVKTAVRAPTGAKDTPFDTPGERMASIMKIESGRDAARMTEARFLDALRAGVGTGFGPAHGAAAQDAADVPALLADNRGFARQRQEIQRAGQSYVADLLGTRRAETSLVAERYALSRTLAAGDARSILDLRV